MHRNAKVTFLCVWLWSHVPIDQTIQCMPTHIPIHPPAHHSTQLPAGLHAQQPSPPCFPLLWHLYHLFCPPLCSIYSVDMWCCTGNTRLKLMIPQISFMLPMLCSSKYRVREKEGLGTCLCHPVFCLTRVCVKYSSVRLFRRTLEEEMCSTSLTRVCPTPSKRKGSESLRVMPPQRRRVLQKTLLTPLRSCPRHLTTHSLMTLSPSLKVMCCSRTINSVPWWS